MCLDGHPPTLPTREYWRTPDDRPPAPQNGHKMKTNGTRILPDVKNRLLLDTDLILDDSFDGLEDILPEDLISELGNDAQWIPNHSTG